jgi:hypothetical protein
MFQVGDRIMGEKSSNVRELLAERRRPKKIRKRATEIPHLNDDKLYDQVLQEHFAEEAAEQSPGAKPKRKSIRTRKKKTARRWWWPKKPIPSSDEREEVIKKIEAIYHMNGHLSSGLPLEFVDTEGLLKHLERLQTGQIPDITKKGILNAD